MRDMILRDHVFACYVDYEVPIINFVFVNMKLVIDTTNSYDIDDVIIPVCSLLHTMFYTEVNTEKDENGNYILHDIDPASFQGYID